MGQTNMLEVRNLKVDIHTDDGILNVVRGISFEVERGKTIGIVGESGCGKSVTGKAILGINPPNCKPSGQIIYDSDPPVDILALNPKSKEIRSIRGKHISMIFQEPMTAFSPLYTIGNQVMENALLHITKDKKEAKKKTIEMLALVGIANPEKRFNQYPVEFSGGMLQRALIAMSLMCNPDVLIADEPTTALDVTIQAQILELMKKLQKTFHMAIIFITHDLGTVAAMCDEVAVMYLGEIVEKASVYDIFKNPQHPYTKGLIASIPRTGVKTEKLDSIEGTVPLAINLPAGCGFFDRCSIAVDGKCNIQDIPYLEISDNHIVKCCMATKEVSYE